jgi:hypothetical protein
LIVRKKNTIPIAAALTTIGPASASCFLFYFAASGIDDFCATDRPATALLTDDEGNFERA